MMGKRCRYCGVPYPGDDVVVEYIGRMIPSLPVCIKSPGEKRWLVDNGVNGHMFVKGVP